MNLALKGTIISIKEIAKRTIEVVIKAPDDFNFRAGQYIWLMLPELKYPDPKGNTRMFSIASSPNRKGELVLIFRTGISGYKKTFMEMTPGSEVVFSGPYGHVGFPEDGTVQVVFLAGGVGATPFFSMIRFANETHSGHKITFIWANPSEEEMVYADELGKIEKENPDFKLIKVFGQLEEKLLKQTCGELIAGKTAWYVMGPIGFVDSVSKFFDNAGVSIRDIYFEQFYPRINDGFALKKIIETARTDKNPFFLAVESTNNHVVITDINGIVVYANKGAEKMTGYTLEEMEGNSPRLWGGLMPREFYKNLWNTKKYKLQTFSAEIKNRRKNQDVYYSITHSSPILNEENKLIGFIATEEDITGLKELDNAKDEFISVASHQLRTPISGLNWLLEAFQIKADNLTPKQKEYLGSLEVQSKRLIALVEDLLNFSRIQAKVKFESGKHKIKIPDFIESFIKETEPYASSKKHNIVFKNKLTESFVLELNDKALYNILQNLISNAIDYSQADTTVTVSLEKTAEGIKIYISNQGPIIPKEEQARLFQKFYRGESVKKMKAHGTGLGLYMVKTIIENMGGSVGFRSEEGEDTVFWFIIPLNQNEMIDPVRSPEQKNFTE